MILMKIISSTIPIVNTLVMNITTTFSGAHRDIYSRMIDPSILPHIAPIKQSRFNAYTLETANFILHLPGNIITHRYYKHYSQYEYNYGWINQSINQYYYYMRMLLLLLIMMIKDIINTIFSFRFTTK
jgi:hypothetical protein